MNWIQFQCDFKKLCEILRKYMIFDLEGEIIIQQCDWQNGDVKKILLSKICLNIVTHSEWPWAWLLSEWEILLWEAFLVKWSRNKILTSGGEKRGLNSRGAGGIGGLTMMASIKSLCLLLCLAIVQGKNNHESSPSTTSSTVIFNQMKVAKGDNLHLVLEN